MEQFLRLGNLTSLKVLANFEVSTVDTLVAKPRDAVAIVLGVQSYQRLPLASFAANDARQFRDHAIKYLGVRVPNHFQSHAAAFATQNSASPDG
jgi:hypothetical protein